MQEPITNLLRQTPSVDPDSIHVESLQSGGYLVDYTTTEYTIPKRLAQLYRVEVEKVLPRGAHIWVLLKCTSA